MFCVVQLQLSIHFLQLKLTLHHKINFHKSHLCKQTVTNVPRKEEREKETCHFYCQFLLLRLPNYHINIKKQETNIYKEIVRYFLKRIKYK